MIEHARTITVDLLSDAFKTQACEPHKNEHTNQQDTPQRVSCFFPNTRGVVELCAQDGSTVLLAATGHIRSFIAQRMNEDGHLSPRANLAPITTKIIAYPTGSAFESDWIVLERARSVDPELLETLGTQNRRAVLIFEPQSTGWRVEDTLSLPAHQEGLIIGPIRTKGAARALGEALDDVFELCRYPKELAKHPLGTPCAYKEMGRCPGACDGSESLAMYMQRHQRAAQTAGDGIERWKEALGSCMDQASRAMEFERAQQIKRQLDLVEKLPADAIEHAKGMNAFRCVCITPSVRKGWALLWWFDHDGLVPIVSLQEDAQSVGPMLERWMTTPTPQATKRIEATKTSAGFGSIWLDQFALFARHWMTKPVRSKRRRVTVLDLRDPMPPSTLSTDLRRAIAAACTPSDPGHDDEEHTHIRGGMNRPDPSERKKPGLK